MSVIISSSKASPGVPADNLRAETAPARSARGEGVHLAIDKPSTFRDPMTTVSTTIALSVAPVRNEILSAALARELGQSCILRVTQQNVEADHLVATSILERWNNSSDVEQASLLGASNDGTLAALPQLSQSLLGTAELLPGKIIDGEALAFLAKLLAPSVDAVTLLRAAECAAELRAASRAALLDTLGQMSLVALAAVSRAFNAQAEHERTLDQHARTLVGGPPTSQLRALLLARLESAAAQSPATPDDGAGAGVSTPSAAMQSRRLHAARHGFFRPTDEDAFIEVIGFAGATQAAALRYEYAMRFGQTLESAVQAETSGELQSLLLAFLDPPPSALTDTADLNLAELQARRLWHAADGAADEWVRIFTEVGALQLGGIMLVLARHGQPLTSLIRNLNPPGVGSLLLVRCRWAATAVRRRADAVREAPALAPLPPPAGYVNEATGAHASHAVLMPPSRSTNGPGQRSGVPKRLRAASEGAEEAIVVLRAWAVRIASTPAAVMPWLCDEYRIAHGASADLHSEVHAYCPRTGHARELLLALLRRHPTPDGRPIGSADGSASNAHSSSGIGASADVTSPSSSHDTSLRAPPASTATHPPGSSLPPESGQVSPADAIYDCPSGGTYTDDGPADCALAEEEAEALLAIAPWHMLHQGLGGNTSPLPSPRSKSVLAPAARAAAESALLALLGRASFAQLAAVETALSRRLHEQHPADYPYARTASRALLQWSACAQLHPLCVLVLEQRVGCALAPAVARAVRVCHAARRLFGRTHEMAIGELICSAPSHELPLICRHVSVIMHGMGAGSVEGPEAVDVGRTAGADAPGAEATRLVCAAIDDESARELLSSMLRPRGDARPDVLLLAETAAEDLAGSMLRTQLMRVFVNSSDAQLGTLAHALDRQPRGHAHRERGGALEQLVRQCISTDEALTRQLLLWRCARVRTDVAHGADLSWGRVVHWPPAGAQADALYRAGKGKWLCTDRSALSRILNNASPAQAAALRYEYAMRFGQTLPTAIRRELPSDSVLATWLLSLLFPPMQPPFGSGASLHAHATTLTEALGTERWAADPDTLIRIMASLPPAALTEAGALHERAAGEPLVTSLQKSAPPDLASELIARLLWARHAASATSTDVSDAPHTAAVSPPLPLADGLPPSPLPPPPAPTAAAAAAPAASAAAQPKADPKATTRSAAEVALLEAMPELESRGFACAQRMGVRTEPRIDTVDGALRLVRLVCAAGEDELHDLCAAYRARTSGEHLRTLVQSEQLQEVGMPAPVRRLLAAMLAEPPPPEPRAVDLAEGAAELATCDAPAAIGLLTAFATPRDIAALASCYARQRGRDPADELNERLAKATEPMEAVAIETMLRRGAAAAATAAEDGLSTAEACSDPAIAKSARRVHAARRGFFLWATDEDAFIEVIGFAGAAQAAALRYEYAMRFGQTLGSAVQTETSGELQSLLLAFLDPPPSALNPAVDAQLAESQAVSLHDAAEGAGTRAAPFVAIFGSVNHGQLGAIMNAYERAYAQPLLEMLRHEFTFDVAVRKLCVTRCRWARAPEMADGALSPRHTLRRPPIAISCAGTATDIPSEPPVTLKSLAPSAPGQLLLVRIESDDPNIVDRLAALRHRSGVGSLVETSVPIPRVLTPPAAGTLGQRVPPRVAIPQARALGDATPSARPTSSPLAANSSSLTSPISSPLASPHPHTASGISEPTSPPSRDVYFWEQQPWPPRMSPRAATVHDQKPDPSSTVGGGRLPAPPRLPPPPPSIASYERKDGWPSSAPRPTSPPRTRVTPAAPSCRPRMPTAALPSAAIPPPPVIPSHEPQPMAHTATAPSCRPRMPRPAALPPSALSPPAAPSPVPAAPPTTLPSPPSLQSPAPPSPTPPIPTPFAPPNPPSPPVLPTPHVPPPARPAIPQLHLAAAAPSADPYISNAPPPPSMLSARGGGGATPRYGGGGITPRGGSIGATPRSARNGHGLPRGVLPASSRPAANQRIGPPVSTRELQQTKARETLGRLLTSSVSSLERFDATGMELGRAAGDMEAKCRSLVQMLDAEHVDAGVLRTVREALVLSEHATADMAEAAERAHQAVEAHRMAHAELAESVDANPTGVVDAATMHRSGMSMPTHPSEAGRLSIAEQQAVLRDAIAECRKVLKHAEQVFATSRARAGDATSAVAAAVTAARRKQAATQRGAPKPFESRALS